ncbi:tetratricopeptide repeat protein, partial [Gemmatimonadota bacterium]
MRAGFAAGMIGILLALPGPARSQTLSEALDQLRSGRYEEALPLLQRLSRGESGPPAVRRALARALLEVGRYEDARAAVTGDGGEAVSLEVENVLGEAHFAVGRIREAEESFRKAVDGGASDAAVARMNLGVLLWNRGERDQALTLFDSFFDLYNSGQRLTAEELMAVGTAMRFFGGARDPVLYEDALLAFDDAAAADP